MLCTCGHDRQRHAGDNYHCFDCKCGAFSMALIAVQTIRTEPNRFEFMQTWYCGMSVTGEKQLPFDEPDNDRLRAAIMNVGFACRDLFEIKHLEAVRIVAIESDKDGRDMRFNGEHDVLYTLLCPQFRNDARKVYSLYAEYAKYLARIKELCYKAHIEIRLSAYNSDNPYAAIA